MSHHTYGESEIEIAHHLTLTTRTDLIEYIPTCYKSIICWTTPTHSHCQLNELNGLSFQESQSYLTRYLTQVRSYLGPDLTYLPTLPTLSCCAPPNSPNPPTPLRPFPSTQGGKVLYLEYLISTSVTSQFDTYCAPNPSLPEPECIT